MQYTCMRACMHTVHTCGIPHAFNPKRMQHSTCREDRGAKSSDRRAANDSICMLVYMCHAHVDMLLGSPHLTVLQSSGELSVITAAPFFCDCP